MIPKVLSVCITSKWLGFFNPLIYIKKYDDILKRKVTLFHLQCINMIRRPNSNWWLPANPEENWQLSVFGTACENCTTLADHEATRTKRVRSLAIFRAGPQLIGRVANTLMIFFRYFAFHYVGFPKSEKIFIIAF